MHVADTFWTASIHSSTIDRRQHRRHDRGVRREPRRDEGQDHHHSRTTDSPSATEPSFSILRHVGRGPGKRLNVQKTRSIPTDETVAANPTAAFDVKLGNWVIDPGFFTRLVYEGV